MEPENKVPDTTDLFKKTDFGTKIGAFEIWQILTTS